MPFRLPIQGLFSDPKAFLLEMLVFLPAVVIAFVFHEVAHAFVAYKLGDQTAKWLGRLTLDPVKHIDPIGFVMLVLMGFGWAKPVPINPDNFKKPRRDDFLVSIAGITANLLFFLLFGTAYFFIFANSFGQEGLQWIFGQENAVYYFLYARNPDFSPIMMYLTNVVMSTAMINISFAVFNFLPIPPLDGYHVLNDLILKKSLFASSRIMRIGQIALIVLLFSGMLSKIMEFVISGAFTILMNTLYMAFGHFI